LNFTQFINFFIALTNKIQKKELSTPKSLFKGSSGLVVKVSASQPRDYGFEPYSGHDHVSSYDTSTGWFKEADSKVINISCKNFFAIELKKNMLKPNWLGSVLITFSAG
jgi:hypothetical protein